MSVIITTKSLLPVRRDKQVATNINITGGGGVIGTGTSGQPPVYLSIINGTPTAGQVAVFHDASSIEGDTGFTYDKVTGRLTVAFIDAKDGSLKHLTITAGNASGSAGTDAGDLTLKAGDAIFGDASSVPGAIFLVPGTPYFTGGGGTIWLGDNNFNGNNIVFYTAGQQSDVSLNFIAKGSGTVLFSTLGNIQMQSLYLSLQSNEIIIGATGDTLFYVNDTFNANGWHLTVHSGNAYGNTSSYNGGDLHLNGGSAYNAGTPGKVFIGTGSGGSAPLPEAGVDDTCVLTYNPTTGQVSWMTI